MTARKRIVDILVEDKLWHLATDQQLARHILTSGFPGFDNMSASQLQCMVCDAGLDLREGMGVLLHDLAEAEPLVVVPTAPPAAMDALPIDGADPLKALAQEIRYFFQNEASSPVLVKVMLETLGPQAASVRAEDDFKGLDNLSASQLRRLVPVSFALRDRVRTLLAQLEGTV